MSDRVDTEAVREYAKTVKAYDERLFNSLCDELDRTREALREYGQHTTACAYSDWKWGVKPAHLKRGVIPPPEPECDCGLRALLAESGNTELPNFTESGKVPQRCPTCGSDNPYLDAGEWATAPMECPDPWHSAPLVGGGEG